MKTRIYSSARLCRVLLAATVLVTACGLAHAAYEVNVFAGAVGPAGSTDGAVSDARFNQPTGVAVDSSGNAYVADMANCTIRQISAGVVSTLAGSPGVVGGANGSGITTARFSSPKGVAVDANGAVYVADTDNHAIRKILATNGNVVTIGGSAGLSGSTDGTDSRTSRFNSPQGVAVDAGGTNVYVADTGNHTIRWIGTVPNPSGTGTIRMVLTAGGAGLPGSDDGDTTTARFNQPKGVAVDSNGDIYVADTGNGTIRKIFSSTGEITTLAGNPNAVTPASIDGIGSAAQFNLPQGIAVDASGNVFVGDVGSGHIRKVPPFGMVTTLSDATGTALVFNRPTGLALDSNGKLYVTNDQDNTISVVTNVVAPPAPQYNPFVWSKRIASTVNKDDEFAMGMATDSAANLYVTGWFDGTNDFGGTSLTNKSGGGQDIFVGKYNSAGELQWAQRAGGDTASQDTGRGVGVDAAGNVYVTGGFSGTADFGSINITSSLERDFFLAKYNSSGVVQWVRHNASGGTNNSAYGTGLTVDASGNSYAVGYYDGSGVTFGATTLINAGDNQCFLVKYDSAGNLLWAQSLAGTGFVYAIKVALDSAGNVCLSGTFTGSMNVGGTNLVSVGGQDIFVAKLSNDGVLQWAHRAGGTGDEMGDGGVAVDAADNVFITGLFSSSSISFGGTDLINAGSMDAYIAKYDSAGALLWARRAGDANLDGYMSVAVDKQGNAYASGASASGVMVAKYDPAGTLQWTHSASSAAAMPVGSIAVQSAVDSSGNCYLAGLYQTATTFGTNVLQPVGYWNFFLAKLFDDLPYTYTVNNGQVTITKYTGSDANVTIPATINGLPVTRIADSAFYYCLSLTKVTIPSSVTTIESYAFQSCGNLTSVIIPPGVTSIGDGAFEWCYSLTDVTIPASVTSFGSGDGAFLGCIKLTAITVDPLNTVYRSVNGVLFNYGLTTLLQCPGGKVGTYVVPAGVTSIGLGAFCGCINLLAITVDPLNTSFISNNGVLFDPTQTTLVAYPGGKSGSYVIPANVTSIAAGAFAYCTSLSAVTIPVGISSLGMGTFAFCNSLTSISIPAGVTSLGQYAFSSCANLASVTIPNSVTSIGDQAFEECRNLIRVSFMGNAPSVIGAKIADGTASGLTIYYFHGATGFTGVPWDSLPQVDMGVPTPAITWLVDKALPHDADLKAAPKGDEVSLLMAYALNLDPQHNLSASLPKPVVVANQLRLDYYAGNNDVTYAVETSIDLQHWTKVGVTLSDPDGNNVRKATVAMTDKRRYLRLVVEH